MLLPYPAKQILIERDVPMCSTQTISKYQSCCYVASCNLQARFCNDCGQALNRCPAFEECGGLLDREGHCTVCFSPKLTVEAGSLDRVKVGGKLAIPMVLSNESQVGRPLFVKGIWVREGDGDWKLQSIPWERLDSGESKTLVVDAKELEQEGLHRLEILLALSSRWRWREEVVAFSTGLEITVEGDRPLQVQQNIHYAADAPQTGATIYAPFRVTEAEKDLRPARSEAPRELTLTRAQNYEREFGLRGLQSGLTVPRTVRFEWSGFAPDSSPVPGPITTPDGTLLCGRSRSRQQGGDNDLRLLAWSANGELDEEDSRRISRQHFLFCIQNDRLMLRVESESGVWVDGEIGERGQIFELQHDSVISPFASRPERLQLKVQFEVEHGEAVAVTLSCHQAA